MIWSSRASTPGSIIRRICFAFGDSSHLRSSPRSATQQYSLSKCLKTKLRARLKIPVVGIQESSLVPFNTLESNRWPFLLRHCGCCVRTFNMTIKTGTKSLRLREQIIEDAVSGLTLKLEVAQDGTSRLMIYGGIPYGNREFIFDGQGKEAGARTGLTQLCCPSTLQSPAVCKAKTVSTKREELLAKLSRVPSPRRPNESMRAHRKNVRA
jgi:hypothetical protein